MQECLKEVGVAFSSSLIIRIYKLKTMYQSDKKPHVLTFMTFSHCLIFNHMCTNPVLIISVHVSINAVLGELHALTVYEITNLDFKNTFIFFYKS
jgi:hypothetical protein